MTQQKNEVIHWLNVVLNHVSDNVRLGVSDMLCSNGAVKNSHRSNYEGFSVKFVDQSVIIRALQYSLAWVETHNQSAYSVFRETSAYDGMFRFPPLTIRAAPKDDTPVGNVSGGGKSEVDSVALQVALQSINQDNFTNYPESNEPNSFSTMEQNLIDADPVFVSK